jgi:hypothetical protein
LPLDKTALPDKAEEINAKLAAVKLPEADAAIVANISMETAQLQAECADPTESCYLKIAQLVEADRLLWAEVDHAAAKAKKKKAKPGLKLQVILFDRDKLAVAGKADAAFAGGITSEDIDRLIATATGAPASAPAAAAPSAQTQPAPAPAAPINAPQPAQPGVRPALAPTPAASPTYQTQPAAAPATYGQQPTAPAASAPAAYQPAASPPPAAAQPTNYPPPAAAPQPAAAPAGTAPPPARYP